MLTVLLCVFIPILLISLWLFARFSAQKPRVYVAPASRFEKALERYVPCVNEVFHPTWWRPFGFLQTAVRQLVRSCPSLPFERELVSFADGGELATDWLNPEDISNSAPIVIFFPGITGSTHDCSYILHSVVECTKLGYRSVVINPRGLGGVILKTAQTYNAAWTSDVRHVIEMISGRYPEAPKIGVGFSMGGMILWNYLADCDSAEATGLKAALCISSPFDPMDATFTIEEFFPRIFFNSHLAENLKRVVRPYKSMFEGRCNWEDVMACKTVRDFDKAFVVPLFGYKDWPEYYHAAALYWKVHKIPIPTLCLNAADDCFSPLKSIPFPEVVRSDNVAVVVTQHGGHTAFMRDANASAPGLIEDVLTQFTSMIFTRNAL